MSYSKKWTTLDESYYQKEGKIFLEVRRIIDLIQIKTKEWKTLQNEFELKLSDNANSALIFKISQNKGNVILNGSLDCYKGNNANIYKDTFNVNIIFNFKDKHISVTISLTNSDKCLNFDEKKIRNTTGCRIYPSSKAFVSEKDLNNPNIEKINREIKEIDCNFNYKNS